MFNKTMKKIMPTYIPQETITCHDRDPSCISKDKQLILDNNHAYKSSYLRSDKSLKFFNQFQFLQTKVSSLIKEFKNQYYTSYLINC